MTDQPPIAKKVYYSIGEVCELAGLKAHVLRYWENQFNTLKPGKNRAGNRVYRSRDVEVVLLIRHLLYEKRYTIDGANQKLTEMRRGGELKEAAKTKVAGEFLSGIKRELEELRDVLTMPSEGSRP
jgi:DNA-binding transcriptional MerR regulator